MVHIRDRGSAPYWCKLDYAGVCGRVGDNLVAYNGNTLTLINAWTGEVASEAVTLPGARIIPSNNSDANLFVVGGDAVVYALFAR